MTSGQQSFTSYVQDMQRLQELVIVLSVLLAFAVFFDYRQFYVFGLVIFLASLFIDLNTVYQLKSSVRDPAVRRRYGTFRFLPLVPVLFLFFGNLGLVAALVFDGPLLYYVSVRWFGGVW